ncbi:hypothetical protein BJV82DRAFT_665662 [Fennellomyces sp. T-0311]|nr:hypothetical protein BJV82DRAFT_665662 [Fennellomyces sp. T-0311]
MNTGECIDPCFAVFMFDMTKLNLSVNVLDSKESLDGIIIAHWGMWLADIREQHVKNGMHWWTIKDGPGKIHVSVMWKSIAITRLAKRLGYGQSRLSITGDIFERYYNAISATEYLRRFLRSNNHHDW